MDKRFNIIKLNDAHIPFEDEEAIKCAIDFCKRIQPDIIITDEWMDFYELSRFLKDPKMATGYTLHEARLKTWEYFKQIQKACPNARRIHLNANHTKRMQKYLYKNAHELCGLPEFQMEIFMDFKRFNMEYMNYFTWQGVFLFKHGDRVHKFSAYTAKNELDNEGISGASGHSHRLGQHYRTKRGGEYTWIECGCLCDLEQEYLEGRIADWQQGIGLVSFIGNSKYYFATTIPIIDYNIMWGI